METGGQLHAPAGLPPGERVPSVNWIEGWVRPKAGLDVKKYKKNCFAPAGNRIPAVQPVASQYTD
jgi:hypothetical protein